MLGFMMHMRTQTRNPERALGFEFIEPRFEDVLYQRLKLKCTDNRDRVFALLSLASIDKNMPFYVDYTRSVVDVYTEIARALIHFSLDLDVLMYCYSGDAGSMEGLPSWAPDWTAERDIAVLIDDTYEDHLKATADSTACGPSIPEDPKNNVRRRQKRGNGNMVLWRYQFRHHDGLLRRPTMLTAPIASTKSP
jgi:hypothetical protein